MSQPQAINQQGEVRTPGPVTERIESGDWDGEAPSGIEGPFFQRLAERKKQGRDAKVLVTAQHGQTGVGKSNLCDFLGYVSDTSPQGFNREKVTANPIRFIELYGELDKGSACVMEEGEQFDSRRGMTKQNVEATQKWQQARVREIIAYVNLPDPSMIDSRFEKLADFWINVEERGEARIYQKKIHSTKQKVYYKTLQVLSWPNMDGSDTFVAMDELKADLLDGLGGSDELIRESEAAERIKRAREQARVEARNEWIKALKNLKDPQRPKWTGEDIAALPCVDVSGPRVNQIARGE